jgi:hypothetical protein
MAGTVWHVTTGGTGAQTGVDWDNALPSVAAGLNAAQAGDTVRVWVGYYPERITLKPGVALSGGHFFGGAWLPFWSILDGSSAGTVVTVPAGAGPETVLEGFTIQNGLASAAVGGIYGGGLFCANSSPTLQWNHFTNCQAVYGGAMYLTNSSPLIHASHFTGNKAQTGGAIVFAGGAPIVGLCTFRRNAADSGGGALALFGAPNAAIGCCVFEANRAMTSGSAVLLDGGWFLNNTLLRNIGTADGSLAVSAGAPVAVINNIIAGNSSGLKVGAGGAPVVVCNDVFGNSTGNYKGVDDLTGAGGNISRDPALDDSINGSYAPCFGSPCVDKGYDAVVPANFLDYYDNARISGPGVDIGAAELAQPPVLSAIRVKGDTGNDANDGLSWATAKKTVYAGYTAAIASDRELWVAKGNYYEWFMVNGANVMLYGGFAGTETKRNERDPQANETTLSGWGSTSPVLHFYNVPVVADRKTIVDGFTISDGFGGYGTGAGIMCSGSSVIISGNRIHANKGNGIYCSGNTISPYIACNTITHNQSPADGIGGARISAPQGHVLHNVFQFNGTVGNTQGAGALTCLVQGMASGSTTFQIRDNVIEDNWGKYSGGITVQGGTAAMAPVIRGNIIRDNDAYDPERSGGIYATDYFELTNNLIQDNGGLGGGLMYGGRTVTDTHDSIVANNVFVGGGVTMFDGYLAITNNTFYNNPTGKFVSLVKPGPYVGHYTGPVTISNNIFQGCNIAVYRNLDTVLSVSMSLANCAFHQCYSMMWAWIPVGADQGGHVLADPRLANPAGGDFHLRFDSPCVDAGLDASVLAGWTDLDRESRIVGAHVDIGADEYATGQGLTLGDIGAALRAAAGLEQATPAGLAFLNVVNTGSSLGKIDLQDVTQLLRSNFGL